MSSLRRIVSASLKSFSGILIVISLLQQEGCQGSPISHLKDTNVPHAILKTESGDTYEDFTLENKAHSQESAKILIRRQARFMIGSLSRQSCFAKVLCGLGSKEPTTQTDFINDYAFLIGELVTDDDEEVKVGQVGNAVSSVNQGASKPSVPVKSSTRHGHDPHYDDNGDDGIENLIDPEFIEWMAHANLAKTDPEFFKQVMRLGQQRRRTNRPHRPRRTFKDEEFNSQNVTNYSKNEYVGSDEFTEGTNGVVNLDGKSTKEMAERLGRQLTSAVNGTNANSRQCRQIFGPQCPYNEEQMNEIVMNLKKLVKGEDVNGQDGTNVFVNTTGNPTKKTVSSSLNNPNSKMEIVLHLNQNLTMPFPSNFGGFPMFYGPTGGMMPMVQQQGQMPNGATSNQTQYNFTSFPLPPVQMPFVIMNPNGGGAVSPSAPVSMSTTSFSPTSKPTVEKDLNSTPTKKGDRFDELVDFLYGVGYLKMAMDKNAKNFTSSTSNLNQGLNGTNNKTTSKVSSTTVKTTDENEGEDTDESVNDDEDDDVSEDNTNDEEEEDDLSKENASEENASEEQDDDAESNESKVRAPLPKRPPFPKKSKKQEKPITNRPVSYSITKDFQSVSSLVKGKTTFYDYEEDAGNGAKKSGTTSTKKNQGAIKGPTQTKQMKAAKEKANSQKRQLEAEKRKVALKKAETQKRIVEAKRRADMEKRKADTEKRKADAEKRKADAEKRKADADKRKADADKRKADADKRKADADKRKADADKRKADADRRKADADKRKGDEEEWKIQNLGKTPDGVKNQGTQPKKEGASVVQDGDRLRDEHDIRTVDVYLGIQKALENAAKNKMASSGANTKGIWSSLNNNNKYKTDHDPPTKKVQLSSSSDEESGESRPDKVVVFSGKNPHGRIRPFRHRPLGRPQPPIRYRHPLKPGYMSFSEFLASKFRVSKFIVLV